MWPRRTAIRSTWPIWRRRSACRCFRWSPAADAALPELCEKIVALVGSRGLETVPRQFCELPEVFGNEAGALAELLLKTFPETRYQAMAEALLVLGDDKMLRLGATHYPPAIHETVAAARARLERGRCGLAGRGH